MSNEKPRQEKSPTIAKLPLLSKTPLCPIERASLEHFRNAIEAAPLGVYDGAQKRYTLIPASADPLIIRDEAWAEVQNDASLILTGIEKVASWLAKAEQGSLAKALFAGLSPIEKDAAFGRLEPSQGLSTARLDLFFDGASLSVIEVNATIPAMQAYSDMIREAYFSAIDNVVPVRRKPMVQSNVQDLLRSLLQHYEKSGGERACPRIAIVARHGDSQLAELLWLKRIWEEAGHECMLAEPNEIELKGGRLYTHAVPIDLTYRHIFAHRLVPESAFFEACTKSQTYKVFNPISAHLEAKGVLAELSRCAINSDLSREVGLTARECEAVIRRVPWSRLVASGPATLPDDKSTQDLTAWLKAHRDELVIKSSLGYGGHGVVVGTLFDDAQTQAQLVKLTGMTRKVSWAEFIDFCVSRSESQWIAQLKLDGFKVKNRYFAGSQLREQDTYVDCSVFTSSGITHLPTGGAVRFSPDLVVNIGRGGGLVPLLLESEATALIGAGSLGS